MDNYYYNYRKPALIIYHHDLFMLEQKLTSDEFKEVIMAMCRYSAYGEIPETLSPKADLAFGLLNDKLYRDNSSYIKKIEARSKAGKASGEARRKKAAERKPEADEPQPESPVIPEQKRTNPNKDEQNEQNEPTATVTPTVTVTPTATATSTPTVTPTATSTSTAASSSSSSSSEAISSEDAEIIISAGKKEEEFPPTREMILAYAREKSFDVDADDFLDRCRANNWKDGSGEPIRNWRMYLKGYLVRQSASAVHSRCAPDPRIAALERLKQKYMAEEAQD